MTSIASGTIDHWTTAAASGLLSLTLPAPRKRPPHGYTCQWATKAGAWLTQAQQHGDLLLCRVALPRQAWKRKVWWRVTVATESEAQLFADEGKSMLASVQADLEQACAAQAKGILP